MTVDPVLLQEASRNLSDVVADPQRWAELLEQISRACDAEGAGLLPYRGDEGLTSPAMQPLIEVYRRDGWYKADRDPRKRALPFALRGEVAIDADIIGAEELRRSPFFNEYLSDFGVRWWAGIGFRGGEDFWCVALQRADRKGQFDYADKSVLQGLVPRLTEIGTLCRVAGNSVLANVTTAFERIGRAALAVDKNGRVIRANARAEELFDDAIRVVNAKLIVSDSRRQRTI